MSSPGSWRTNVGVWVETHIFEPWVTRCRKAKRRVLRTYAPVVGARAAAAAFTESLVELRHLGLHGNALVVAAEYMAYSRLRSGSQQPERVLEPA